MREPGVIVASDPDASRTRSRQLPLGRWRAFRLEHLVVGLLPDHSGVARSAQLRNRILVVNVSVQPLVYGVAAELLESSRELPGDVRMDSQVLVFLLSDEARAVVVGDRKAARVAAVGAAAMPEAAMAEDDAAGPPRAPRRGFT